MLLDSESRSLSLDADPSHGQLREPLLKVTSFLRSMDAKFDSPKSWSKFSSFNFEIGQDPYGSPSVFSFFLPEYSPAGAFESAKLVAPESQVLTGKFVTKLLDGLFSTIKFGLVSCYNAFGETVSTDGCPTEEGNTDDASGKLLYRVPDGMSVSEAIDDLGLLLTAGRLSLTNKNIIKGAIEDEYSNGDKAKATRIAQQLILSSPEFHSWGGTHDNSGITRKVEGYKRPPKTTYKSLVYFFMDGGADSFNLIVPKDNCRKNMYEEYKKARGPLAVPKDNLLEIDASQSNDLCDTWGIHPNFPILKELYDAGEATFFLNMGILCKCNLCVHGPFFSHYSILARGADCLLIFGTIWNYSQTFDKIR